METHLVSGTVYPTRSHEPAVVGGRSNSTQPADRHIAHAPGQQVVTQQEVELTQPKSSERRPQPNKNNWQRLPELTPDKLGLITPRALVGTWPQRRLTLPGVMGGERSKLVNAFIKNLTITLPNLALPPKTGLLTQQRAMTPEEQVKQQEDVKQLHKELSLHWDVMSDHEKVSVLNAWADDPRCEQVIENAPLEENRGPVNQWLADTLYKLPAEDRTALFNHLDTSSQKAKLFPIVFKEVNFLPPKSYPGNHKQYFDARQEQYRKYLQNQEDSSFLNAAAQTKTSYLFVGGGPRTATQLSAEMTLLAERKDDFDQLKALGAQFNIHRVVVERQGDQYIGRGNAWGPAQGGGTVNTGAESGYENRLKDYYTRNKADFQKQFESKNPVAASLFKSVFNDPNAQGGEPVVHRSGITRSLQGEEELQNFRKLQLETSRNFPEYHLTIATGVEVQKVDLSNPKKPVASIYTPDYGDPKKKSQHIRDLPVDAIRLNTGTTLVNPITDPEVRQFTFAQSMDPVALKDFLKSKELLDEKGMLKENVKLALGGTGLSAYDQVLALQQTMNLFVLDESSPTGYKVNPDAAAKYKNAITFISSSSGSWIPPRHSNSPQWTQQTDPYGTPEELHAAFLHRHGEEVFKAWYDVELASIAAAMNMTPEQVEQTGLTTAQLLKQQHANTAKHARLMKEAEGLQGDDKLNKLIEAQCTLEAARRQAFLGTILGVGMTRDIGKTIQEMSEKAPLTFAPYVGYPFHRAQLKAVSDPSLLRDESNVGLMKTFNTSMRDNTSSPYIVHDLAPALFDAGIASHVQGRYSKFSTRNDTARNLVFEDMDGDFRQFDAFIVSPIFKRKAEKVIESLAGQVQPVHEKKPDLPLVGTNRMMVINDEGQMCPVEDYSLNGKGSIIDGNKIGAFATDVNNRESATDVMAGLAYRSAAQWFLEAAGFNNPIEVVEKMYQAEVPNKEAFTQEVLKFAEPYNSLMHKSAYAQAVKQHAGHDQELYNKLIVGIDKPSENDADGRTTFLDNFISEVENEDTKVVCNKVKQDYAQAVVNIRQYEPAERDTYLDRFVDAPLQIHERVYESAFKLAKATLEMNNASNALPTYQLGPRAQEPDPEAPPFIPEAGDRDNRILTEAEIAQVVGTAQTS